MRITGKDVSGSVPSIKVQMFLRHRVRDSLPFGQTKSDHTFDLLGYTPAELREHIFNHPNWSRVKSGKWSIDHIFPITAFVEHGVTNLKIINALDNLQPLLLTTNREKHDKYDPVVFKRWLASKGVQIT